MSKVCINRKEDLGKFVIEFEDGKTHAVDVISAGMAYDRLQAGNGDPATLLAKFREAIGLPSLSDFHTLQVQAAFEAYLEDLQKNVPWLRKYFPNTGTSQPPQKNSLDSTATSAASEPAKS